MGFQQLLGATDALANVSPVDRREMAARTWGLLGRRGRSLTSDSFLKRQQSKFCEQLADWLLEYDREYRLKQTRNQMELGAPADRAVAVDWLDRFQYYYRVWTDLVSLKHDFEAFLIRRGKDPDDPALPSYYESSLWFYALEQLDVDRFVEERGGIWLFSDIEVEQQVADALYHVSWHAPASTVDASWLALAARNADVPNAFRFRQALRTVKRGRQILRRWAIWLNKCKCDLRKPSPKCEVHRVIRFCRFYAETIDREWRSIASWYSRAPARPHVDTIDLAALYEQYPYELKDLDLGELEEGEPGDG